MAHGLKPSIGGSSLSFITYSDAFLTTSICFPPGAIYTQPFCITSPSAPSLTLISLISLSLAAKDAVNPAGICCTSTTPASRFLGSIGITCCNDFGPPVEQASATTFLLPLLILVNLDGLTFGGIVSLISFLRLKADIASIEAFFSDGINDDVLPDVSLLPEYPDGFTPVADLVLSTDALELVAILSISCIRFLKSLPLVSK